MWYKYVDRASYDAVRIWRYILIDADDAILNSTKIKTEWWKVKIQDSSLNIYSGPQEAKDQ